MTSIREKHAPPSWLADAATPRISAMIASTWKTRQAKTVATKSGEETKKP
jgi:hypothetical protein